MTADHSIVAQESMHKTAKRVFPAIAARSGHLWGMQRQDYALAAAHVTPVSVACIVVTASRAGRIGDDRAGGCADQPTCNCRTCRSAREASDQRAGTATDQRPANYAVLARRLAPGKCQPHHSKQHNLAHPSLHPAFFDSKKLSFDVRIRGGTSIIVHESRAFQVVSKSSLPTYIGTNRRKKILLNGEQ
jgi:hypothetical protein